MEPTILVCLACHQKTFNGKIDPDNGSVQCGGLYRHITQKQDKQGNFPCLLHYQSFSPPSEIDLTTSVVGRKKRRKPNPPAPVPEDASFSVNDDVHSVLSDAESHSSCFSLQPDHPLADLFVPKSNSLSKKDQFLQALPKPDFLQSLSFSTIDLNRKTLPSQKLTTHISLDCIYKSAAELLTMEAAAQEALSEIEDRVDMAEQEDVGDEIILPDDFMEDDQSTINDLWDDYYLDDDESSSLCSDQSTNASETSQSLPEEPTALPNATPQSTYLQDRLNHESENSANPRGTVPPHVICHSELLRLQDKHRFSMAAVSDILKWATLSVRLQDDIFQETMWSRERQVVQFRNYLGLQDTSFQFQENLVQWLPDNKPTVLWKRPFLDCVYELLTNQSLLGPNMENISLPHPSDPFSSSPDVRLPDVSELHHGTWWMNSHEDCCEVGSTDILCPLTFETDETFIDANGKLSITPFNIKLGIFNMETNLMEEASTTWFFLPNDSTEASHHEKTTHAVHKLQNLHSALRVAFEDLRNIMDNNTPVPWTIHYGGRDHVVNLKFAVSYVISDTAMHDKLCCHYGTRNAGVKCICRHCNCATPDLVDGDAFMYCDNYTPEDVDPDPLIERVPGYWKSISHYPIANAFDELYFGANPHKIHLATPGEVLHMHQKGAMWRVVESLDFVWRGGKNILLDSISAASKQVNVKSSMENFDYLSHQMGRYLNRQSDRNKPRTKFSNSVFSKTKKNAHEQAGVLLCILLAMVSDRGRQITLQERTMSEQFVANFVYVLELVLMFEVWIKRAKFKVSQVLNGERLMHALSFYMKRVSEICIRGGMGALLIKNHLVLHIPDYIYLWGPPRGMDSANMERSHKTQAKRPAGLTQKRPENFIQQTAARYTESRIFKRIRRFFSLDQLLSDSIADEVPEPAKICGGSRFQLGIDSTSGAAALKWIRNPGRLAHPQEVIDFVAGTILWNIVANRPKVLKGFTEYRQEMDDGTFQLFRAHPSYRSASRQRRDVWYDWALFDLSIYPGFGLVPRPAQILMFVDVPELDDEVTINNLPLSGGKPHAVVRMFDDDPDHDFRNPYIAEDDSLGDMSYSYLLSFGRVSAQLYLLPCERILDTAIVVPNIETRPYREAPKNNREISKRADMETKIDPLGPGFFLVQKRESWGTYFGNLIDSF